MTKTWGSDGRHSCSTLTTVAPLHLLRRPLLVHVGLVGDALRSLAEPQRRQSLHLVVRRGGAVDDQRRSRVATQGLLRSTTS